MKIGIISGSHRATSESGRVALFMEEKLKGDFSAETYMLDLGQTPLPLWDDGMWRGEGAAFDAWKPVSPELESCDGFVIVAAEWNGTAPAALKNFFHYASTKEFAHKAGLLVGVSASINGAYPIAELHMSSVKNSKLCYVPDHLIIRNVADVLQGDESQNDGDAYIRERMDYSLDVFNEYVAALKNVRESGKAETEKYGFGM